MTFTRQIWVSIFAMLFAFEFGASANTKLGPYTSVLSAPVCPCFAEKSFRAKFAEKIPVAGNIDAGAKVYGSRKGRCQLIRPSKKPVGKISKDRNYEIGSVYEGGLKKPQVLILSPTSQILILELISSSEWPRVLKISCHFDMDPKWVTFKNIEDDFDGAFRFDF